MEELRREEGDGPDSGQDAQATDPGSKCPTAAADAEATLIILHTTVRTFFSVAAVGGEVTFS